MRIFLTLLLTIAIINVKGQNKWGFEAMINSLIKNSVDTIDSQSVKELLESKIAVLIDAREKEEYEVSHIPGAISVGYKNFDVNNLPEIDKDQTVIVSCSIGKRSEDIGMKLKEAGYTNVKNHYGGIFDWTNRGLPVEDTNGNEVNYVHPYNTFWGFWVNNYEKAYEPR